MYTSWTTPPPHHCHESMGEDEEEVEEEEYIQGAVDWGWVRMGAHEGLFDIYKMICGASVDQDTDN